jgi:hypothetical protein
MARRKAPVESHVARDERTLLEHGKLSKGDVCKVSKVRGTFRFMYATLDDAGNVESYTVFGGVGGRGQIRSFTPDRVSPVKKKRIPKDATRTD